MRWSLWWTACCRLNKTNAHNATLGLSPKEQLPSWGFSKDQPCLVNAEMTTGTMHRPIYTQFDVAQGSFIERGHKHHTKLVFTITQGQHSFARGERLCPAKMLMRINRPHHWFQISCTRCHQGHATHLPGAPWQNHDWGQRRGMQKTRTYPWTTRLHWDVHDKVNTLEEVNSGTQLLATPLNNFH